MKQLWKQILAAALCLLMAAAVFACKKTDDTVLQIAALKGPTGLGLAKLAENKSVSANSADTTLFFIVLSPKAFPRFRGK